MKIVQDGDSWMLVNNDGIEVAQPHRLSWTVVMGGQHRSPPPIPPGSSAPST